MSRIMNEAAISLARIRVLTFPMRQLGVMAPIVCPFDVDLAVGEDGLIEVTGPDIYQVLHKFKPWACPRPAEA